MRAILVFAVVAALACPHAARAGGIAGRVLSRDARPVARAVVAARRIEPGGYGRASDPGDAVSTDHNGAFEFRDLAPGLYTVTFRAPGYSAERVRVEVPGSFSITLPAIRLPIESYARARFVSAAGSPVLVNRVVGRSFDAGGVPLPDARDEWTPTAAGADGSMKIGPLPRGVTMLGIDMPGVARTRLPDVRVSGDVPLVDLGTIVVARGANLQVRVLDSSGAPQANAHVTVVDTAALTPFQIPDALTDAEGRAMFDRLPRGTYRLIAEGGDPCGPGTPGAERVVEVPAQGRRDETLVVGGARVTLEVTREGAALAGIPIVLEPERAAPRWPSWWPTPSRPVREAPRYFDRLRSRCSGSTDGEGRLGMSNVPFGPARVTVHLANASWSRVASIPIGGRLLRVDVPARAVSLRVVRADTGAPVAAAEVGWDSAQGSVRARATETGDVLLDGVPQGAGTFSVTAAGFVPIERELGALPDGPQELGLTRLAPPFVLVRVSDADGAPIENAVVYLDLQDGADDDAAAPTDPHGVARFDVRRPAAVQVTAWASGYARASTSAALRQDADDAIAITLQRSRPSSAGVQR